MNEQVKEATERTRELSDDELRERVIQLAFGGNRDRFDDFVAAAHTSFPDDVSVLLRGSAVIGVRWEDGSPFDAEGPGTSDLDLTLVGGDMLKLWSEDAFYIPSLHTAPLNDETPNACPPLVPVRETLCRIAGRPVNIQATASLVQFARDVLMDQPYYTLVDADARREAKKREAERRDAPERDAGARHIETRDAKGRGSTGREVNDRGDQERMAT